MEITIEVIVIFIISLVVGLMIFLFVFDVDYLNFYNSIKDDFMDEDGRDLEIEKLSINETIIETLNFWQDCEFGALNKSKTIYIIEDGVLSEEIYWNFVNSNNLCKIILGSAGNCEDDDYEEVRILGSIDTPKIIKIRCEPIGQVLVIE